MGQIRLNVEISEITAGSCEVLIVGWDLAGASCVIDAQQCEWPLFARTWRGLMDAARRWVVSEAAPEL